MIYMKNPYRRGEGGGRMRQGGNGRDAGIIRCNLIGIAMNLSLSVGKILIGTLARAHAVALDGINSLSDLLSMAFTILSTRLGARKANAAHPFGYGRLEYLCSLAVTAGVMYCGVVSIVDAVDSIIHPHQVPDYNGFVLGVMGVSLVLKLAYGLFMRRQGRRLNSAALVVTGADSMGDALVAVAILAGAGVYRLFGVDIEHYLCIGIALMILWTGLNMARQCLNKLLGERADPAFKRQVSAMIAAEEGVLNVCNLVIHKYGEAVSIGSADIEVDENLRAADINRLTLRLKRKADALGLTLTSVGIIGTDVTSPEAVAIWDRVIEIASRQDNITRVQAFTLDAEEGVASFFVVHDYADTDWDSTCQTLQAALAEAFPHLEFVIYSAINT